MSTSLNSNTKSFLQIRGETWATLTPREQKRVVDRAFHYWRANGFPHYRLSNHEIKQEFVTLRNKDWKGVFSGRNLRSSNTGLRIANAFQPTMWKVRVDRYRTPLEVFLDDRLLRKAIERALTIWPDRFGANASCLRRILKTFPNTASVSNYRPLVAKAIMGKYSREGTVVDFSAGYGGRLLGALALHRTYIGIEPNLSQTIGLRRMTASLQRLQFVLPKVEILNGVAENELLKLSTKSAELVFSSPPFFNWERYSKSGNQSFRRFPAYADWLTCFLKPVIAESYRILETHGKFVVNVTNGNRLPPPTDVRSAAEKVGFKLLTIHHMVFPKIPYLHPRDGNPAKSELLLVFKK